MNWKVAVPVLLLTHGLAGGTGFFVAKQLLAKDPNWVDGNRKTDAALNQLDQAAAATAVAGAAEPPAGWQPEVARFSILDYGISRVSFTSDAPLEQIVGTTTKVTGSLSVDSAELAKSKSGPIEVEVGTLKTGNDTRDGHLQGEGWFDTEKHPKAVFTLERVEAVGGLWPGKTADVTVHGKLAIKGIEKAISAQASVGWFAASEKFAKFNIKGDVLRIKTQFSVTLADFGMSAEVIGQKVAEVVQVDLNLTAVSAQ